MAIFIYFFKFILLCVINAILSLTSKTFYVVSSTTCFKGIIRFFKCMEKHCCIQTTKICFKKWLNKATFFTPQCQGHQD